MPATQSIGEGFDSKCNLSYTVALALACLFTETRSLLNDIQLPRKRACIALPLQEMTKDVVNAP